MIITTIISILVWTMGTGQVWVRTTVGTTVTELVECWNYYGEHRCKNNWNSNRTGRFGWTKYWSMNYASMHHKKACITRNARMQWFYNFVGVLNNKLKEIVQFLKFLFSMCLCKWITTNYNVRKVRVLERTAAATREIIWGSFSLSLLFYSENRVCSEIWKFEYNRWKKGSS